jgi:high-affinity iron transporter
MLIATGVLLGVVLLVMVGESVQEMQLAGWLPSTSLGAGFPGWLGLWLAVFPTVEGVAAQAAALVLVAGSYVAAERVRGSRASARRPGRAVPES